MSKRRPLPGGLEAASYDYFRDRILPGRQELISDLPAEPRAVWVELGAGTGRIVEFLGHDIVRRLERVYLVEPHRALLDLAELRCRRHANITIVEAAAARTGLPDRVADVVVCSYALTTMPDWMSAIDEARRLLGPGGWIGVVDFHRASVYPTCLPTQHAEQYMPPSDQLAYLHERFRLISLQQEYGPLPGLPGAGAPFYRFIGAR